jgi:hypothetical protein
MGRGLTPDDFDRIRTFLEKPKYARDPDDLVPKDGEDEGGGG